MLPHQGPHVLRPSTKRQKRLVFHTTPLTQKTSTQSQTCSPKPKSVSCWPNLSQFEICHRPYGREKNAQKKNPKPMQQSTYSSSNNRCKYYNSTFEEANKHQHTHVTDRPTDQPTTCMPGKHVRSCMPCLSHSPSRTK